MTNTLLIINSPLDLFAVEPLVYITGPILGDIVFALTNFAIYAIIVISIVLGLHILADNGSRLVPSYWSIVIETVYASVLSFSRDQLGNTNEIYVPFAYALFWILIIANLAGNVPYGFAIASSAVISIGLSVIVWGGVTIIGLVRHRLHFFSYFVPSGTPLALVPLLVLIEIVSYLARAVSLGVRVFANILSGHLLLSILATFLFGLFTTSIIVAILTLVPMAIFTALVVLEIVVSIIQAYVFVTLVCSYISDAINLH